MSFVLIFAAECNILIFLFMHKNWQRYLLYYYDAYALLFLENMFTGEKYRCG